MTLQSRINTGGHPREQRKPWTTQPEQITLGHGHHIQPIANSLARRLGASGDGTADASLVHRISPRRSNLLSRIQGCEMGDANVNGNGTEREDERALDAERTSISPFTSQNATKTLRHSATPTPQMSPGPSGQKGVSHEDSIPPRGTPSSRSSQIHTHISRATLTSAISQNAKLRRGEDTDGLSDKVDAVVTSDINELFRNTLQKAQTELSEKQAAVPDDESPASAFLKELLPSVIESRSQSLDPATEPERPKHPPAAPKAMLRSPGTRLVESMLQAGADLTLPDEEPDSVMHATRMSRPSSSYHWKDIPSRPVRSDSRATHSSHDEVPEHHRYNSEHRIRSSRHSKSPHRTFSRITQYDTRTPSPRRHRSRSPRNQRSTRYDRSRSPYRGRRTHRRDYSDPSPRRNNYSARNRSTSSKYQSPRYDRRRQDPESSRRSRRRESLSPERGVRPHRDSQWIPEAESKYHMVYDEPEPMSDFNNISDVPGVWAFQHSRNLPDILECTFNVSEEVAAKWNLTRENNRVMAEGETRDELFLHLLCLPAALAVPVLTDPSQEPKTIADALWKMQTEWPEGGSLIIEINPGKPVGKVFFPGDHPNNIHSPLEVTHTIQQGVNTIRFVQLTGMHKSFVLFASHRDIPILDLTALAELLQFRTL